MNEISDWNNLYYLPMRTSIMFNAGNLIVILLATLNFKYEIAGRTVPYIVYLNLTLLLS